jgi:hypothetical protein
LPLFFLAGGHIIPTAAKEENEEDTLPAYSNSVPEGDYNGDIWKEIEEDITAA